MQSNTDKGISINHYIKRIADISIGVSTLRGHGSGTMETVKGHLRQVDLAEFQCASEKEYLAVLEKHTQALRAKIQGQNNSRDLYWGSARKSLNIFMGGVCYHAILRHTFDMERIEPFLEVPLDKQVANNLIQIASERGIALPEWRTIKGLSPQNSAAYQMFASRYAH